MTSVSTPADIVSFIEAIHNNNVDKLKKDVSLLAHISVYTMVALTKIQTQIKKSVALQYQLELKLINTYSFQESY